MSREIEVLDVEEGQAGRAHGANPVSGTEAADALDTAEQSAVARRLLLLLVLGRQSSAALLRGLRVAARLLIAWLQRNAVPFLSPAALARALSALVRLVLRSAPARWLARLAAQLVSLQLVFGAGGRTRDGSRAYAHISSQLALLFGTLRVGGVASVQLAAPSLQQAGPLVCRAQMAGSRNSARSPDTAATPAHAAAVSAALGLSVPPHSEEVHLLCSAELKNAILAFLRGQGRGGAASDFVVLTPSTSGAALAASGIGLRHSMAARPFPCITETATAGQAGEQQPQQQPDSGNGSPAVTWHANGLAAPVDTASEVDGGGHSLGDGGVELPAWTPAERGTSPSGETMQHARIQGLATAMIQMTCLGTLCSLAAPGMLTKNTAYPLVCPAVVLDSARSVRQSCDLFEGLTSVRESQLAEASGGAADAGAVPLPAMPAAAAVPAHLYARLTEQPASSGSSPRLGPGTPASSSAPSARTPGGSSQQQQQQQQPAVRAPPLGPASAALYASAMPRGRVSPIAHPARHGMNPRSSLTQSGSFSGASGSPAAGPPAAAAAASSSVAPGAAHGVRPSMAQARPRGLPPPPFPLSALATPTKAPSPAQSPGAVLLSPAGDGLRGLLDSAPLTSGSAMLAARRGTIVGTP